jgi:2-isopropylmalate synthase
MLALELLGCHPHFFQRQRWRVLVEGGRQPGNEESEASLQLHVGQSLRHTVATGDGPVNAMDAAMRAALISDSPSIERLHLHDYAVRVVNPAAESAACVRVRIDFKRIATDGTVESFSTVGVHENVLQATWMALDDGFSWHLLRERDARQSRPYR